MQAVGLQLERRAGPRRRSQRTQLGRALLSLELEADQRRQGLGAGEQGRERGWRGGSGRAGSAADPVGDGTEATGDEACGGIHGDVVQRSKEQVQRYGKRDRMQRNEKEKGRPEVLSWGRWSSTRTRSGARRQGTLLLLAGEGEHGRRDDVGGGQRG